MNYPSKCFLILLNISTTKSIMNIAVCRKFGIGFSVKEGGVRLREE